jgi:DNA repair exonuclease SbcCD nuclease subunit
MKAVITADNHLNKNYNKMRPEQLEQRRQQLRDSFEEAVRYAIENDADLFLHCGDLFDMSNPVNKEVAYAASKLSELENNGVKTFLTVGNHDMSITSEAASTSPHSVFESFEGPYIFMNTKEPETETVEVDGETYDIIGVSYDPLNKGEDPLKDFELESSADHSILLTHYGIEGTVATESREAAIQIGTIAELDLDLLCSGHIHKTSEMDVGGTKTIVPGGTERLDFNEKDYSTGFYVAEFEGDEVETSYVETGSQQMKVEELNVEELENPQSAIMSKVEESSSEDQMLQLKVEGSLPREDYRELEIHKIWKKGRELNFYFDIRENISIDIDSSIQTDGERLSQEEELKQIASKIKENEDDDADTIEKASRKVVNDYREN